MIAELLNRRFVFEQLQAVQAELRAQSDQTRRRRGPAAAPSEFETLSGSDYEAALGDVDAAIAREEAASSGQPGNETPPPERRGEPAPASLDDFVFISRDPVVSNVQAALDQYFEEHASGPDERIESEAPPDDRRRDASDVVMVTDRRLANSRPTRDADGRRLFGKFEITDPGWVASAVAMGLRWFRGKRRFPDTQPLPVPIANTARLVLVGDWASGLPRAQDVAAQMRRYIDGDRRDERETHVIHLGDTYYSGWKREYDRRFLAYWPVPLEKAALIRSWSLNANHDMYSGGHGYFDHLLVDPRFARQGRSSYFSLSNDAWKIVALDTAWDDDDLAGSQPAWVSRTVSGSDAKVIVLSHHQVASAYETAGTKVAGRLRDVLDANRVRAWFWGHEHRCMVYTRYGNIEFPRCVGHGGIPAYMWHRADDPYPAPGEYEYREALVKGLERWALMGFAVLDFNDAAVHVRYVDETGTEHRQETLR